MTAPGWQHGAAAAQEWMERARAAAQDDRSIMDIGADIAALAAEGRAIASMTSAPLVAADTVEALYGRRDILNRQREILAAEIHDIDAELCRRQGDDEAAAWHRCAARARRTGDPKDEAREDEAWAHMMAVMHLRAGTVPAPESHRAADVVAAMARIAP